MLIDSSYFWSSMSNRKCTGFDARLWVGFLLLVFRRWISGKVLALPGFSFCICEMQMIIIPHAWIYWKHLVCWLYVYKLIMFTTKWDFFVCLWACTYVHVSGSVWFRINTCCPSPYGLLFGMTVRTVVSAISCLFLPEVRWGQGRLRGGWPQEDPEWSLGAYEDHDCN